MRVLNFTIECDGGYDYSTGDAIKRPGTVTLSLGGCIVAERTIPAEGAEVLRYDGPELENYAAGWFGELFEMLAASKGEA